MNRYLIFGAGAVGTLLGGLLAKAGHGVVFVGRHANMAHLRTQGIHITGLWGDHLVLPQPHAYTSIDEIPNEISIFDHIFICTKAFDTGEAIDACRPLVAENTWVIPFQNGYGNCQLVAERIGWERTLGARVITGVELKSPGAIEVTVHADAIRLGHYHNRVTFETVQKIVAPMQQAGVVIEATDQLEQYVWAKILYNAALNPLGALLGATYGELAEHEATRELMNRIIHEAFAVTHAHGIQHFWPTAEEYLKEFYGKMVPATAKHYPSMRRDIERKKRTEIGVINGAISDLGQQKSIATPVNDTAIALIHFRESSYLA